MKKYIVFFITMIFIIDLQSCHMNRSWYDKIYDDADELVQKYDYKGAANLLEAKILKYCRDYKYYMMHGAYTQSRDSGLYSAEALKDFQKAYKKKPEEYLSNYYMGSCYYSMDKYNDAVKYLEKSVKLYDPTTKLESPYYDLAAVYIQLGDYKKALENNQKTFLGNADFSECYVQKGIILSYTEGIKPLTENYKKAKQLEPDYLWLDHQYAWQLILLGYYEQAEKLYRGFLKENENYYWCYTDLGYAALLQGKWDDGLKLLKKAEFLNPMYKPDLQYLSFYYFLHEKDYDKAYRYDGSARLINSEKAVLYPWKSPDEYMTYYRDNQLFQKLLKLYPVSVR